MYRNLKPITENSKKKIITFWNIFKKNEQEILNVFLLGINTEEVLSLITKKLDYVSRRIGYVIKSLKTSNDKFIIIFTGNGYRKLFSKILASENRAQALKHFTTQAFIKPLEDTSEYKNGTDDPCNCGNYEIKISELQIALLDYNIATKQIKINLYLPDYDKLKHLENLKVAINWIVLLLVGEIAFRKHIRDINLHQMLLIRRPTEPY